mmetsp:Transcript_9954/g.28268  ORF Transcript_9954/g.28268 Transcript_9954/m.28268 type:complete len:684 (-) Transcript_9954:787-2838(-)
MAAHMEMLSDKLRSIPPMTWAFYALLMTVFIFATVWIEVMGRQREWHCLTCYALVCGLMAVGDGTPRSFFRPIDEETSKKQGVWSFVMLTSTSFISWIMAKSVQNSSKLGGKYGVVGGLAYASWFFGIFTTAVIVYQLRKKGYHSLPDFVNNRYGKLSAIVYLLVVTYRLLMEVWSNTIVIADFFGERSTANSDDPEWDWYFAAWVSMVIPAVYTIIGGMRASLLSDFIQTIFAYTLLLLTYFTITTKISNDDDLRQYANKFHESSSLWKYNPDPSRNMWSLAGGLDLVFTGLLQGSMSYTFMDPALTDRAFLASKELMLPAFAVGSVMAIAFITLFGFIGVYGNMVGSCVEAGYCDNNLHGAEVADLKAGLPSDVGQVLGREYYAILALIMITSAISTLDSTFSAVAKVIGPDLWGMLVSGNPIDPGEATAIDVTIGRVFIVVVGIAGTMPIYSDPDELDATTVSGTMVPGLGPPIYMLALFFFLFPNKFNRIVDKAQKRPVLFLLPFLYSAALGTMYQMQTQDMNCESFKALQCGAPIASNVTTDLCTNYETYFDCMHASGCWTNMMTTDCKQTSEAVGCSGSLHCRSGASDYEYFVDLSGFNMGKGSYKNLFGVNVVSAVGALGLFLFASMDEQLELHFPESEEPVKELSRMHSTSEKPVRASAILDNGEIELEAKDEAL